MADLTGPRPGAPVTSAVRRLANRGVAALRPHLPPSAFPLVAELVSVAGAGPVRTVPDYDRVLVVAPHPDDETIGCGGTVALLAARGCRVDVLIASDGEATAGSGLTPVELAARRRAEATAACALLGARPPSFAGLPDGGVGTRLDELATAIGRAAEGVDAVFAPWPLDGHPDHMAVSRAVGAARLPERAVVWGYEVWAALPPNRVVDVTAQWPVKEAALAAHTMASVGFDAQAFLALQRWRSIFGGNGGGYQEAFLVLTPDALRSALQKGPDV